MIVRPFLSFWFMIAILIGVAISFLLLPLFKDRSSNVKRWIYFVYLPIFAIAALGLYGYWGAHDKVSDLMSLERITQTIERMSAQASLKPEQVAVEFDALAKELNHSAPALARLGMLSIELGWYDKSAKLYERAMALDSQQEDYWVQWVYSHSMLNGGRLPQGIKTKAQARLATNPSQFALVNILAIDDYFIGDYPKAIAAWRTLLERDHELSPERRQVLLKAITKARGFLPSSQQISFKIQVQLSPELITKASPNDPVFVVVRKPKQAMPLLVLKKRVSDLPCAVELDDQHSMVGGAGLTDKSEVEIVAKVSKSGDPLDKAGDLRGISEKIMVKLGENPAKVVINQQV